MLLNVYELPVALQEIYKEESLPLAMEELGISIMVTQSHNSPTIGKENKLELLKNYFNGISWIYTYYPMCVMNGKKSFQTKYFIIQQKELALNNISKNIEKMSDSSIAILNDAFEAARNAYKLRQDLELSVLNSQLKLIEIDILKLKTMTADEFEIKYGAV